jgi:hypothetical protein
MARLWIFPSGLLAVLCVSIWIPQAPSAPAPVVRRPKVELVFVVDTTGSMSLVEPMKQKIYSICNLILSAKPAPELRVGLLAFKDRDTPGTKEEYLTKPFDLRDHFDEVFAEFKTYTATGGGDTPEAVNEALDHAIHKLSWSKDRRTIKLLFLIGDAPPHMDYPDDVKYPITCKKAQELGITIHSIQVGNDRDCEEHFAAIAKLGGGDHLKVPSSGGFKTWATEHDSKIRDLGLELFRTALPFGEGIAREQANKELNALANLSGEALIDRICIASKRSRLGPNDLLDAVQAGRVRLRELKEESLPEALRRLDPAQRETHLERLAEQRTRLYQAIVPLDRARTADVLKQMEQNPTGLDVNVMSSFRKQAAKVLKY